MKTLPMRITKQWTQTFLLDPARSDLGTWVVFTGDKVGCVACKAAELDTCYARCEVDIRRPFRTWFLKRHHRSKTHRLAVATLCGRPTEDDAAPSREHFRRVFDATREASGRSKNGLAEIGQRLKVRRMKWCLAEAIRTTSRRFLAKSKCIGIMQDVRKNRLLVRFKAARDDLVSKKGTLGQVKLGNVGAEDLRKGVVRILQDFCTPMAGAPRRAAAPELDQGLLESIYRKVEHIAADAAADEQRAARDLRPRAVTEPSLRDTWAPLTNLKVVSRDRAHASRRLTKEPWKEDPYLRTVMERMVTGRRSITHLIQHSDVLASWFQANVRKVVDKAVVNLRIKDMSMCKARFDSTQRPVGRGVLFHQPTLLTAQQIVQARRDADEVRIAMEFLRYVDAEVLLTLGLLADAGDEASAHLRFCDSENADPGELAKHNKQLMQRIACLFGPEGRAFECGYSKFILENLRRTPVVVQVDGKVKTIGGADDVPEALLRKCLNRMAAWCRLAQATLHAEFPDFDVLVAFDIFDLSNLQPKGPLEVNAEHAQLLCRTFGVDLDRFLEAFKLAHPVALHARRSTTAATNVIAWSEALGQVKKARRTVADPLKELIRMSRETEGLGNYCLGCWDSGGRGVRTMGDPGGGVSGKATKTFSEY